MVNKIIFVMGVFLIMACSSRTNSNTEQIVQNISSPDRTVNAIITKYSYGGGTGSFVYKMYLKQYDTNKNISQLKPLLLAEKVDNISIKWTSFNTLQLNIVSERIINFTNFWWNDKKDINYYIKMKN